MRPLKPESEEQDLKLRKTSELYRELRELYTKNETAGILHCRPERISAVFENPKKELTIEKIIDLDKALPHISLKKLFTLIAPDYYKPWYKLEDHDYELLKKKFER